jgi:hypothetical protein
LIEFYNEVLRNQLIIIGQYKNQDLNQLEPFTESNAETNLLESCDNSLSKNQIYQQSLRVPTKPQQAEDLVNEIKTVQKYTKGLGHTTTTQTIRNSFENINEIISYFEHFDQCNYQKTKSHIWNSCIESNHLVIVITNIKTIENIILFTVLICKYCRQRIWYSLDCKVHLTNSLMVKGTFHCDCHRIWGFEQQQGKQFELMCKLKDEEFIILVPFTLKAD